MITYVILCRFFCYGITKQQSLNALEDWITSHRGFYLPQEMFMAMFRFNLPFVHFARRTVAHLRAWRRWHHTTGDLGGNLWRNHAR